MQANGMDPPRFGELISSRRGGRTMVQATTIGLDIAKQVFQVHCADRAGKAVLRRKLKRSEVARFVAVGFRGLPGFAVSSSHGSLTKGGEKRESQTGNKFGTLRIYH